MGGAARGAASTGEAVHTTGAAVTTGGVGLRSLGYGGGGGGDHW
jgi:hypothetical protein